MDDNVKIACCSTLNDLYFNGFLTFFYSLITNTPSFNYPYYIFTWGDLSEKNISLLKNIYSNFIIRNINNSDYEGCEYNTKWRTWDINCINRFEIFTLEEYDRVIFFDADLLCIKNIENLFKENVEFGACELPRYLEVDHPSVFNKKLKSFNGGLMSISKKYLNNKTKKNLIDIAFSKKWTNDEPILNSYFNNTKVTFLSKQYCTLTYDLTHTTFNAAKILHFIGVNKPWHVGTINKKYDNNIFRTVNNSMLLMKVDNLYQQYYNNMKKQYGL